MQRPDMEVKDVNILIVDDEAELRNLLARILELEGYRVFTAENGTSALKKVDQEIIHVVITDVQMPGMDGIELIEKIKKQSPTTEVICLTAYGKIADGVKAMKNGAYDYLEKDSYHTKIIPLVAKAVEKSIGAACEALHFTKYNVHRKHLQASYRCGSARTLA